MRSIKFLIFLVIIVSICNLKYKPHAMTIYENKILDYEYLYNNSIRFHFVANSDSDFDQMVKNRIKDEIINYINENTSFNKNDKYQNLEVLREKSQEIKEICENVLSSFDLNHKVELEIGEKYFNQRGYGDYLVPEGVYDSFTVYIGQGIGINFWSMLFTSIGFIDSKDSKELDSMVEVVRYSREALPTWSSSSSNDSGIRISFKVFEVVKNLLQKIF